MPKPKPTPVCRICQRPVSGSGAFDFWKPKTMRASVLHVECVLQAERISLEKRRKEKSKK